MPRSTRASGWGRSSAALRACTGSPPGLSFAGARSSELLERVGLSRRALQPLPARVLGRPAPADRDRAGPRAAAEADHRRRAGLRARRLDPGADHQPARRPAGRVRPHLHLRRARPRRRAPRLRPDRGHVPGKIVEEGTADQVCEYPTDPYTKNLLAAVPIPDPRESAGARRASCRVAAQVTLPLSPPIKPQLALTRKELPPARSGRTSRSSTASARSSSSTARTPTSSRAAARPSPATSPS